MSHDLLAVDSTRDTRNRLAHHLADLHRLHLVLANDARSMKAFSFDGRALAEIELASEMLEQYLGSTSAFLENMRGRFEARLALLRRGEPIAHANRDDAPGHAEFWLAFSRLTALLRRVARCAEM
jgi:hypothetical protein